MIGLLAAGACATDSGSGGDVVGPFSGPVHRYLVDSFEIPSSSMRARELAGDLDGNDRVDNELGVLTGTLGTWMDLTTHTDDMIASGALASFVEIQADDLTNDDSVGVTYIGADGAPARVIGGRLVDGKFHPNRVATTQVAGKATLLLPVFTEADPSQLFADAVEIDLVSDGTSGFDATIHGAVGPEVIEVAAHGMFQMFTNAPPEHTGLFRDFDLDHDGTISEQEIASSSLLIALLEPDILVDVDGHDVKRVSLGVAMHLTPCESGSCVTEPPQHTCFDRVQDGTETGVDCGGSCLACPAPSSCTNAIQDGGESDIDCGWNCGACNQGKHCLRDADCQQGHSCNTVTDTCS